MPARRIAIGALPAEEKATNKPPPCYRVNAWRRIPSGRASRRDPSAGDRPEVGPDGSGSLVPLLLGLGDVRLGVGLLRLGAELRGLALLLALLLLGAALSLEILAAR